MGEDSVLGGAVMRFALLSLSIFILIQPVSAGDNLSLTDGTCALFHFDDTQNGANTINEKGGKPLVITGDVLRVSNGIASGAGLLICRQGAKGYANMNPAPVSMPTGNSARYFEFVVKCSSPMYADYQHVISWDSLNEIIGFYNYGALSNTRLKINSRGVSIVEWNSFGNASVKTADVVGVTSNTVNYFCIAYDPPLVTIYKYTDGAFSTAAVKTVSTLASINPATPIYIGGYSSSAANSVRGSLDEIRISTGTISAGEVAENAARIFGTKSQARDE